VESGDLRGLWSGAGQCQASVFSAASRRAGRWVLPCALRDPWAVTSPGPRGHRQKVASGCKHPSSASGSLPLSFEASAQLPGPSRCTDPSRSSDRATKTLPLLGFVTVIAPPPTHPPRVHSQEPELPRTPFGPTAPPVQPRSARVVSHHLGGFLRAKDRGLVASRYRSWGSSRFSKPSPSAPLDRTACAARRPARRPIWSSRGEEGLVPATRSLPFEEFPPPTAVPCHHGLFLRAVGPHPTLTLLAPHCWSAKGTSARWNPRLRGVALRTGPLRPAPFRAPGTLVPSMGLCPLRGSTSSAASRASRGDPTRPTLRRSGPSGRPWRRGESLRSSRGHPSQRSAEAVAEVCPERSLPTVRRRERPPWGSRR